MYFCFIDCDRFIKIFSNEILRFRFCEITICNVFGCRTHNKIASLCDYFKTLVTTRSKPTTAVKTILLIYDSKYNYNCSLNERVMLLVPG